MEQDVKGSIFLTTPLGVSPKTEEANECVKESIDLNKVMEEQKDGQNQ